LKIQKLLLFISVASAILIVHVDDENDNDPVFRQKFYKRTVMENSQPGVPIIIVMADDIDKNRTIHYSIEGSNCILLKHKVLYCFKYYLTFQILP